jgi:hypothetical protein
MSDPNELMRRAAFLRIKLLCNTSITSLRSVEGLLNHPSSSKIHAYSIVRDGLHKIEVISIALAEFNDVLPKKTGVKLQLKPKTA